MPSAAQATRNSVAAINSGGTASGNDRWPDLSPPGRPLRRRVGQGQPPPVSTTAADPDGTAGAHVGGPGTDTCRPSVALCVAHASRSVFEVAFHYPAAASRRSLFTTLRRSVGHPNSSGYRRATPAPPARHCRVWKFAMAASLLIGDGRCRLAGTTVTFSPRRLSNRYRSNTPAPGLPVLRKEER